MRKKCLEKLTLRGHIGDTSSRKKAVSNLYNLCVYMDGRREKRTDSKKIIIPKATELGRAMIRTYEK